MNLCGETAWKKTARTAIRVQSRAFGRMYQNRYRSGWMSVNPFASWMAMPISELASSIEIRTRAMARVLGTTNAQSGTAVASTISWVRRSRSRQTSSPA